MSARLAFVLTLSALARLPYHSPIRLAIFATEVAGDPHAFDQDRLAGQLLTTALLDSTDEVASHGKTVAEARAVAFEQFGLLVDTV